jgi:hypothetical protein
MIFIAFDQNPIFRPISRSDKIQPFYGTGKIMRESHSKCKLSSLSFQWTIESVSLTMMMSCVEFAVDRTVPSDPDNCSSQPHHADVAMPSECPSGSASFNSFQFDSIGCGLLERIHFRRDCWELISLDLVQFHHDVMCWCSSLIGLAVMR